MKHSKISRFIAVRCGVFPVFYEDKFGDGRTSQKCTSHRTEVLKFLIVVKLLFHFCINLSH